MADTVIAANTGFLWRERPFLERIVAAGRAGFDAVEFHDDAQAEAPGDVRAALAEAGLPLLGLNTAMGETMGRAALPGHEAAARADIDAAIETAALLGGCAVHVLAGRVDAAAGNIDEDIDEGEAWATYRANLAYACQRAAASRTPGTPGGLTVLIEPLSAAAAPGYLLDSVARAASVIEWVGAPNLKIMLDMFHVHQTGGSIARAHADYAPHVGHVQLAHPATRAEPPTDGAHAVAGMVGALRAAGYAGAFGAEYVPAGAVEDGLGWMAALRRA